MSSKLANALFKIGLRHISLRERVKHTLAAYRKSCAVLASEFSSQRTTENEVLGISTLSLSILGFLDAASKSAEFWTAKERSDLIHAYQFILSNDYLIAVETAFSAIRNSHAESVDYKEWKQYVKRYAGAGRPLGAMLLRQAYMNMVLSCASLLIVAPTTVYGPEILRVILSTSMEQRNVHSEADKMLVESLVRIASREIIQLEDGSDYQQLGSAWQQRVAHSVKANSLATFLCCAVVNEELADPEVLMPWLEASLANPSQMSDVTLAGVVLRSLAVMAKISAKVATKMSKTIPRFLVNGPIPAEIASVTAVCLLSVLKRLPQDTVITTLYSLGNSLSSGNVVDSPASYALFNKEMNHYHSGVNGHHSVQGSSLNLAITNSDQDSGIYNAVILTIVTVARGFEDKTITALALSMLVQKVGKVNMVVDLKIITEAAVLAAEGGSGEFRALLRLYMRLGQQAALQNDGPMLQAVCLSKIFSGCFL